MELVRPQSNLKVLSHQTWKLPAAVLLACGHWCAVNHHVMQLCISRRCNAAQCVTVSKVSPHANNYLICFLNFIFYFLRGSYWVSVYSGVGVLLCCCWSNQTLKLGNRNETSWKKKQAVNSGFAQACVESLSCSFPQTAVRNPLSQADVSNHLGCRLFLSLECRPGCSDGGMMAVV